MALPSTCILPNEFFHGIHLFRVITFKVAKDRNAVELESREERKQMLLQAFKEARLPVRLFSAPCFFLLHIVTLHTGAGHTQQQATRSGVE